MRHEHGRDVAVVAEQVALRDPLVGPERLVEVREPQLALPVPDHVLERRLGGGRVTSAASLSSRNPGTRDAAGGRRASTRRSAPARRAAARPTARRPFRTRGIFGASANGGVVAVERLQQREQPADLGVVEPGADVPDVAQLVALVHSEHERTERAGAAARAAGVAGDDELVGVLRLQLQPVARAAAGLVGRVERFATIPSRCWSRATSNSASPSSNPSETATEPVAQVDQLAQPRPCARAAAGRRAARRRARAGRTRSRRAGPEPCCSSGEARAPGRVDARDLAVDDGVRAADRLDERLRDVGEPPRQVVAVPRDEPALAGADVRERAVAVELHLERPPVAVRERSSSDASIGRYSPWTTSSRAVVVALDQQPVLLLAVEVRRDERPAAVQARAVQLDGELAVPLLLEQLVGAVVPDLDGAGAVLALRDLAVERRVLERVVLDVDGERARPRLQREPFGTAHEARAPSRSRRKS